MNGNHFHSNEFANNIAFWIAWGGWIRTNE